MFLIFDTETTGLPKKYNAPLTDFDNWPRLVQLAWQLHDEKGKLVEAKNFIVRPEGFEIPYGAEKVHGISTEKAFNEGIDLEKVLDEFNIALNNSKFIIAHNIEFDINIIAAEFLRKNIPSDFLQKDRICTKEESTEYCQLPGGKGGSYKWPNLSELHFRLFGEDFVEAHNAAGDVVATSRCFLELIRIGVIGKKTLKADHSFINDFIEANPSAIQPIDIEIESNREIKKETKTEKITEIQEEMDSEVSQFTHLHVHTQYSILDGAADIPGLIKKAREYNMKALAITDHGNMFGVKEFYNAAKRKGIKPIIGCEVYVARRSRFDKEDKTDGGGFHLVLLAKNKTGYKNLVKLVSYGWTEGFYYKPRVDEELLRKYSGGLIASTACLHGEVPYLIRHEGIEAAKKAVKKYKDIYKEDFYLELQRHESGDPVIDNEVFKDQTFVNKVILEMAGEMNIKVIATNDVHFINAEDATAHDILLCINTGKDLDDPNRLRYTQQEYFKSPDEMMELFGDVPEAIRNTKEVADKIEKYELNSDPVMPYFPIPDGYSDADEYLKYITYEGAKNRYSGITGELKERIDFELNTVKKMGFPGYFLIVWDILKAARELGVSVGPGRGSAAGSVVAYCLKITDIDPLKYDLLFERFLNPDRISMPDIDIDFDEDGRDRILNWVVEKYGKNKVAHIITFGTMAPKMAIRDVARVLRLELAEADRLAKLIPERPGTTFQKAYSEVPELVKEKESGNELIIKTLKYAEVLEGSVRHTGLHACGIIISKNDLEEHIPIATNKDTDLYVTQFDGKHIESVGMLKMDFLGLKTLSIIKDTLENINISIHEDVDINNIPFDDRKTYELYSKGETTGLFQFESEGMKTHLKALKPNRFEDLIAMNALYRPGPMEYIPTYIKRKNGKEEITYDLPEMQEYLEDTYGITVYQEQVMLLSQKLAGFSKGLADSLRKAMGKKIKSMMDELKEKFEAGCKKNGLDDRSIEKIWKDWEAFAHYAFNKSHSTCYAWISYQTAYLKANYPAEFMAAVLSRNLNDLKKVTFFMDECKRMGLKVLVPDINESYTRFTVNKKGDIRFGLAAIKGIGESAVENIIEERKHKTFKNIYDFVERVNLSSVNKRCIEALALSGCFDSFGGIKRHQFFAENGSGEIFIEKLLKYGSKIQSEKFDAPTLFGDVESIEISKPEFPDTADWPQLEKLNKEKEVIGIYLSAHPLDNFKFEIENFCNTALYQLRNLQSLVKSKNITVAGLVTNVKNAISRNGRPYGSFMFEDFTDTYRFVLFGKDYEEYRKYLYEGYSLLIKGQVQQNQWRRGDDILEFKIEKITQLCNVRDELIKSISIKLSIDQLNDDLINDIKGLSSQKGMIKLKFSVYDESEKINIELFSRNNMIKLSDEFINYLKSNPRIEYVLN